MVQTHLQAQHRKRHANELEESTSAYRECVDLCPAKRLIIFLLKHVGGTGMGSTLAVHVRFRYFAHARPQKEVRPVRRALFLLMRRDTVEHVEEDLSVRHMGPPEPMAQFEWP